MNSKSSRELLCITGSEKNYALDLKWIAEIYADVHISPFPLSAATLYRHVQL